MKIKFFSKIFKPLAYKKHTQKAENRLQSRLTDWQNLMKEIETGDYFVCSTGEKFTGKFAFKTKELEQLYHVRNGRISIILIIG